MGLGKTLTIHTICVLKSRTRPKPESGGGNLGERGGAKNQHSLSWGRHSMGSQ